MAKQEQSGNGARQNKQSGKRRNYNRRRPQNYNRQNHFEKLFFAALFVLAGWGVFRLLSPFMDSIIFGAIAGTIFYPLYYKVLGWCRGREVVASSLSTAIVFLLVFIPMILFLVEVVSQGEELVKKTSHYLKSDKFQKTLSESALMKNEYVQEIIQRFFGDDKPAKGEPVATNSAEESNVDSDTNEVSNSTVVPETNEPDNVKRSEAEKIDELIKNFSGPFLAKLKDFLGQSSKQIGQLISFVGGVIFDFAIMLMVLFYIFMDGHKLLKYLGHLCPLPQSQETMLVNRIKDTCQSAVLGTFLTTVTQIILAMIALAIAGLPAFFLGTLIGFASLIPVVGTSIVTIPIIIYLFLAGKTSMAIFFIIWSIVCFGGSDYLLRPFFMKGQDSLPTIFTFFAIMGGVATFGLRGFIYGPVIFGIMAVLLWIYEQRNEKFLKQQDRS